MARRISSLLLAAALLVMGGCGRGPKPGGASGARIGETLQTQFFSFTVEEARFTDEPLALPGPAAPAQAPPEGMRYAVVSLRVRNTSQQEIPLYYDDFDLYAGGDPLFPEGKFTDSQLPEEQKLPPGKTAEGDLVFLVPSDTKEARLQYDEYYEGDARGESYAVQLLPN